MENGYASLDNWRRYFRSANADIFGVIQNAIMVAAVDFPHELKLKRARITEMLFTCKVTKCFGCDKVELALPNTDDEFQAKSKRDGFSREFETGTCKESEMKCSGGDHLAMELNPISNSSSGDAEALSDELDAESQTVAEVLRIKKVLDNHEVEAESLVIESMRRLQLMALSVEILKATDIAKTVKALRKHESKEIKHHVRALIEDGTLRAWKAEIDDWVKATEAIAGMRCTPESVKASAFEEEEEGLPTPPLDYGAFLTTNTMELSQFFDDLDEDGNLQISGEPDNSSENDRKTLLKKKRTPLRKEQLLNGSTSAPQGLYIEQPKEKEAGMKKPSMVAPREQPKYQEAAMKKPSTAAPLDRSTKQQESVMKKPSISAKEDWFIPPPKEQESVMKKPSIAATDDWFTPPPKGEESVMKKSTVIKPNKPSASGSAPGRLTKPTVEHKVNIKRQGVPQQNPKCPDEDSVQAKLEVAKRKLQERNQALENAKKQRTTQFVVPHNVPKQNVKPGNYSRQ